MPRYILEVAYMGTNYSGFQVQQNANTIQSEISRAFQVFFKTAFELTGSSRTDAGVHALQNFFHFDTDIEIDQSQIYNLNSLLPQDIVLKNFFPVKGEINKRIIFIMSSPNKIDISETIKRSSERTIILNVGGIKVNNQKKSKLNNLFIHSFI